MPAHFYVHDDRSADLNLQLAQAAVQIAAGRPVRPLLVVKRRYAAARRAELAQAYADLGVQAIELRVTPLGGDEESVQKIRSVFAITDAFRAVGLHVVLGCSGNIGRAALALGHVSGFSVGVGMKEKVDHAGAISRQARPPKDEDEQHHFGPQAGVYLPGPAATVRRVVAQAMLAERDIRTRIGCRMGSCANDIAGPAADPREHYLHARADEVAQLLACPPAWRSTMEADRLQRALDLRHIINSHYLPEGAYPLKTRTLRSLLEDIERQQRMSA